MALADDDLKEPTNARARLRRVRQQEAAARYNASFERRVAGNISSVRQNPNSSLHVDASVHTDAQEAPLLQLQRPHCLNGTHAERSTTSLVSRVGGAQMEGRAVNVTGQSLDGKSTAISRLLHGDFYTARGPEAAELFQKKEGKYMRFRAESASRPPNCDAVPSTHDAGTMTRQPKTQTLLHQKKLNHAKKEEAQVQQWPDAFLNTYGVYAHPAAGGTAPVRKGQQAVSKEDDVQFMEPLDLDKVFRDGRMQRSHRRPSTSRPSTASSSRGGKAVSSYCGPTDSYRRKCDALEEERLLRAHEAAEKEAHFRQIQEEHRAAAAARRVPRNASAYDTALDHQNSHEPGRAAILSADELQRIMTLVEKPRTFEAPAGSGGGYRPQSNGQILV